MFKGFKKHRETKDCTIFKHETNGHELKVMHDKLSGDERKLLSGLPRMSDGGKVEEPSENKKKFQDAFNSAWKLVGTPIAEGAQQPQPQPTPQPKRYAEGGEVETPFKEGPIEYEQWDPQADAQEADVMGQGQNGPFSALRSATVPTLEQWQQDAAAGVPTQQPQEAPQEPLQRAPASDPMADYGKAQQGLIANSKAQQAVSNEAAGQLDTLNSPMHPLQKAAADIENDNLKLEEAIRTGKVDPERFYANMGTGTRIKNAIGLFLGSFAGAQGKDNPALTVLNKQIDADIAEQQRVLGTKKTLLEANLRKYKNIQDAKTALKMQIFGVSALRLQGLGAGQQAELLKQHAAMQGAQLAQSRAQQELVGSIKGQGQDALLSKIDALEQVDPKQAADLRSRAVPGVGIATTKEGAKAVNDLKQAVDTAQEGIGELLKINQNPLARANPLDRAKAQTIQQSLVGLLRLPLTGPGAMNEGERKMLETLIANPTDLSSLPPATKVRLETLNRRLQVNLGMAAKAHGLSYKGAQEIKHLPPKVK